MPNSAATSVAALPLLSQSSTACCLKVLSNFFRVFLVSITGAFIQVLSFDVFLYLCPFFRAGPAVDDAMTRRFWLPEIVLYSGKEGAEAVTCRLSAAMDHRLAQNAAT